MNDIERNIVSMQHDMTKLNILIHKNKGKQETLYQENILRENEFMESLKVRLGHPLFTLSFVQYFETNKIACKSFYT